MHVIQTIILSVFPTTITYALLYARPVPPFSVILSISMHAHWQYLAISEHQADPDEVRSPDSDNHQHLIVHSLLRADHCTNCNSNSTFTYFPSSTRVRHLPVIVHPCGLKRIFNPRILVLLMRLFLQQKTVPESVIEYKN